MLTAETVRKLLDYDPETGVFRWRVDASSRARKGMVAGWVKGGYVMIKISGETYRAHRLAWLHVHSCWPPEHIDHANGNRADNRLANIRAATNSQNSANKSVQRNNDLGLKGVSFCKRSNRYRATISVKGRKSHLGYFKTPDEAHSSYCVAASRYFGEFARFE